MAANKIKGLTVEIGGDTSKLGKALESVNKKSKDLSTELGEINKMLKFDPGNADLLAQKQKVLAEAVENTSEKLKILKKAEAQVQEQFERGEVSEEQYRALQREVMDTSRKLASYEKAAKETADAVDQLGDDSQDVTNDTKKMKKGSDDASDSLEDLADKADKAGKAGEGMGAKFANAAKTGLKAVATGAAATVSGLAASSVSAASHADEILTMSTVTGIATDDLQAFSYASELVDVDLETLTKSMAKNIKSMKRASDGSKQYADAYDQLGISVTDSSGNLRDGETVYWEAIDALGKMTNETERDAIAMQLFGKSAQELNPLIEAGAGKMKELTQEARDVGAVMSEDTLNALGSFDDSMQRLKGSAGAAKNSLGSVLLPKLQHVTDEGTELLNKFTLDLNASGGGLDGFVETLDGMAPEIASKLSDLLTSVLDKVTSLAPAVVKVGTGLLTNLVTSLISMLPQLVTTGVELIMAVLNGLTSAIPQITQAIVDMISQLVQALVTGIPQLIQGAVQFLLAILDAIPQILPPLIAALPQIVLAIIDGLLTAIPQLIQGALQFLLAIVDAIPQLVAALVPEIPRIVTTIVLGLLDCIPQLLDAAVQLLLAIVEAIPQICVELIKALPQIWQTMSSYFKQLPSKLWNILKSLVQNFVKWGTESRQKALEGAKNILKTVNDALKQLPSKIWTWLVDAIKKIGTWVSDMASKAKEAGSKFLSGIVSFFTQLPGKIWSFLSNVISKVVSWGSSLVAKGKAAVQKLVTTVVNAVKQLPSKMAEAGKNLVQGLWKGISGAYTWLKNKIKGWVGNVTDFIKGLFGINSPSTETEWMGKMLDEGFAVGIEGAEKKPLGAMRKLSEGMLDEADRLNGVSLERRINHTFADAPATTSTESGMLDKLDKILAAIERGQVLTIDGKTLIGSTVDQYDRAMGQRRALAARGAI